MSVVGFFGGKKKVLIIEDDVVLRRALRDELVSSEYVVLEAGDAQEVLTVVEKEVPDAIVLDLILPLKDGITLLEELRVSGYGMPVIILSNLLGSGDLRLDADRLGASFFNKSSSSLTEIVEKLNALIRS
jgi:DNA-binding response OmpR family regulator